MWALAGGFSLIAGAVSTENADRFISCFAEAWKKVGQDQAKIEIHYHKLGRGNVFLQAHVPGTADGIAAAGRDEDPFLLRTNPLVIFDLPGSDAWITLLISEELAHAFLYASRDPTHVPEFRRSNEAERAACAVMERWQCDMQEHQRMIVWIKSHCRNSVWDPLPWK